MNDYPTRAEFNDLKEEVRQLREQRTEEMKVTRIEVASEDVLKRLESLDQKLDRVDQKQDEHAKALVVHSRGISAFQTEMKEARADILKVRDSQADFRDALKNTATKDDIAVLKTTQGEHSQKLDEQHAMLRQILRLLGQQPSDQS